MIKICDDNENYLFLSNILTAMRKIIQLDKKDDSHINVDYKFESNDLDAVKLIRKLGKILAVKLREYSDKKLNNLMKGGDLISKIYKLLNILGVFIN